MPGAEDTENLSRMTEQDGRMPGQFQQRLKAPNDPSEGLEVLAKVKKPELNLAKAPKCGLQTAPKA
jgi:hypothetical protein